jgi:hypothetical protein
MDYHIAQFNVAQMIAPLDDPRMADFVAQLDEVNALAEHSPGFVWRLQTDEGNATDLRVYDESAILVNMSVWTSIQALYDFTYKTNHVDVFRDRAKWFEKPKLLSLVLWWIEEGDIPSVQEGKTRLEELRLHGPSEYAFTFRQRYPKPYEATRSFSRDMERHTWR